MTTNAVEKANDNGALVGGVAIDYAAVLKALNLNPTDPKVQALVLTCQQYGLDPVLKHMILIQGAPYVTHKGLLHVAHESGRFDGCELVDQGENDGEWWAKVSVYRKDMGRPFTYVGRYPKNGSNKTYGPEMAVVRAECLALRRAFDVALSVQEEMNWEQAVDTTATPATPPSNVDTATGEKATTTRRPPPQSAPPVDAVTKARDARIHDLQGRAQALAPAYQDAMKVWLRQTHHVAKGEKAMRDMTDADLDAIEAKLAGYEDQMAEAAETEASDDVAEGEVVEGNEQPELAAS